MKINYFGILIKKLEELKFGIGISRFIWNTFIYEKRQMWIIFFYYFNCF